MLKVQKNEKTFKIKIDVRRRRVAARNEWKQLNSRVTFKKPSERNTELNERAAGNSIRFWLQFDCQSNLSHFRTFDKK